MAYVPQSPDTTESADRLMFDLLRQAGPVRRMQLAQAHIGSAIRQARRAIAKEHPQWSDLEVKLHWAGMAYGAEVEERLRTRLRKDGRIR